MINRWQGNSGRVQRLPEQSDRSTSRQAQPRPSEKPHPPRPAPTPTPMPRPPALPPLFKGGKKPGGLFSGLDSLKKLIPGKAEELETEDIILLLVLYLMYRESGDSELLMIMGAMFLM